MPPNRLVYITSSSFPSAKASSVQIIEMCAAFAEAGLSVNLISRQSENSVFDIYEYYGISPSFSFEAIPLPNLPRATDWFQVNAVFRQPPGSWICYSRIRDLTAPLIALCRGQTAIVEVHGKPITLRERILIKMISQHRRGLVVSISEQLRQVFKDEYEIATEVAPSAVDVRRFFPDISASDARATLNITDNKLVVYVGGLYNGRGIQPLMRAVSKLQARLLIVGGSAYSNLEWWQEVAHQVNASNVDFVGYQPHSRVPMYLAAADVLAMPYEREVLTPSGENTSQWFSSLKLYEYLAAGRPIVSTDLPVLRTVLKHEYNALLVEPNNVDALRAAIERLLTDPPLATRLAAQARLTALKHTWLDRAKYILGLL